MEHIYFEAQLCSEIATLKEKSNNRINKNAKIRLAGGGRSGLQESSIEEYFTEATHWHSRNNQVKVRCYCLERHGPLEPIEFGTGPGS